MGQKVFSTIQRSVSSKKFNYYVALALIKFHHGEEEWNSYIEEVLSDVPHSSKNEALKKEVVETYMFLLDTYEFRVENLDRSWCRTTFFKKG